MKEEKKLFTFFNFYLSLLSTVFFTFTDICFTMVELYETSFAPSDVPYCASARSKLRSGIETELSLIQEAQKTYTGEWRVFYVLMSVCLHFCICFHFLFESSGYKMIKVFASNVLYLISL